MKNYLSANLICPKCSGKLINQKNSFSCSICNKLFPAIDEKPILIGDENELFNISDYYSNNIKSWKGISRIKRILPNISTNLAQKKQLDKFKKTMLQKKDFKILVLGSGNQRKNIEEIFSYNHKMIFSDISLSADVDIIFDCHIIPYEDFTFDGVIITAVLEHVFDPEKVVREIYRVLKSNGIVYSEIPFMQQVHEGAYDFTRYSMVGHNKLFQMFKINDFGMIAGPGTSLVWALENFIIAFFSSNLLRKAFKVISRASFFWIKYFDYVFLPR